VPEGFEVIVDAYGMSGKPGYDFWLWSVYDADDESEALSTTENNPFTFEMPGLDLIVSASWLLIDETDTGGGGGSNRPGGSGQGPGGGGGGGVSPQQPSKPGDGPGEEPEEGTTDAVTLPAKLLPRFLQGIECGFIPLAAFTPDHIAYLYGYEEGDVKPDENIPRSQAAALIYRLLSALDKNEPIDNPFEFADYEWYSQAVAYLADTGIILGYDDGTFRPDALITRAEYVTMICRFDDSMGPLDAGFSDITGHWAEKYIKIGASNGWISGYTNGTFRPDNYITRGEVVSLINRLLYRGIELEDIPSWVPKYTDINSSHWAYPDIMEASIGHDFNRKTNGFEIWTGASLVQ